MPKVTLKVRSKKKALQTFLFSGNSKSANMKYWTWTGRLHRRHRASLSLKPNPVEHFATVVSHLLILYVPLQFPTKRTREGSPLKSEKETCLSLSCRHIQQYIKSSCDVMHTPNPGYLWHSWKWSEVRMLSFPYSPQSLYAVNQSNTGFKVRAKLFFSPPNVLLTGRTNPNLAMFFPYTIYHGK